MAAAFGLPKDGGAEERSRSTRRRSSASRTRSDSIEAGKLADLIVTDGDPLEIATHVEQVWIAGRETSMENKQTRLFKKYDEKPKGELARKH